MEEFRKIANYNNYSVSNCGHKRNNKTNRILQPIICGIGYHGVKLYNNGKTKMHYVHLLLIRIKNIV
jgi:hypothetical protein